MEGSLEGSSRGADRWTLTSYGWSSKQRSSACSDPSWPNDLNWPLGNKGLMTSDMTTSRSGCRDISSKIWYYPLKIWVEWDWIAHGETPLSWPTHISKWSRVILFGLAIKKTNKFWGSTNNRKYSACMKLLKLCCFISPYNMIQGNNKWITLFPHYHMLCYWHISWRISQNITNQSQSEILRRKFRRENYNFMIILYHLWGSLNKRRRKKERRKVE